MFSRIVSVVVLAAFLNFIFGCTKTLDVRKETLSSPTEKIVEVVMPNGDVIKFDRNGARFNSQKRVIVGLTPAGKRVDINVDDILYARVKKTDVALSIVATLGVIVVVFGIIVVIALATKESCPFVYSYDGENYVFDAEPYGGAICPGLKKTDYSRLEHLKPVEGKYRLLVRNEVEETQYTDEMKLLIVDHAANTEIMPDIMGNMHIVAGAIAPVSAKDENGKDLMKFVQARDDISWQTHLPVDSSILGKSLRHQLSFTFPKPLGAKTAKLLVNAGTALWGSEMIKKMLQLRGNQVDRWYQAVNQVGPELFELAQFVEREELYVLKILMKEGQAWNQRGLISGGGPFITEDRVIPLEVGGVEGDSLTIRLSPPYGFWAIDYLAIEYDQAPAPEVKELAISSAVDQHEKDVANLLRANDNTYQVLPKVGDWLKINFAAPPQAEGTKRSIFLKTSGHYEIHLAKDQPEQTALIKQLLTTPGMIVEYSMKEYLKWRSQQISAK